MEMKRFIDQNGHSRVRWKCPLCRHQWDFHEAEEPMIGFMVVHHLVSRHNLNPNEIMAYDEVLEESILEYPCHVDI